MHHSALREDTFVSQYMMMGEEEEEDNQKQKQEEEEQLSIHYNAVFN